MSSESNWALRVFQDGSRYFLPKDSPEHERLDAQSLGFIDLMDDRPFRAPLSNPKKILDVGCGTGTMTHLLGTLYPNAQVIGVDLAPVPESRHGLLPNVSYIQGDIIALAGQSEQLALDSFDYIHERLLVVGVSNWPRHIASISRLLAPGGWLECVEVDMCLHSSTDEPIGHSMHWFATLLADGTARGMDFEVGRHLETLLANMPDLGNVHSDKFTVLPALPPPVGREKQEAMITQLPMLFSVIVRQCCGLTRSEEEVAELLSGVKMKWERGFDEGDYFPLFAVRGQKRI